MNAETAQEEKKKHQTKKLKKINLKKQKLRVMSMLKVSQMIKLQNKGQQPLITCEY